MYNKCINFYFEKEKIVFFLIFKNVISVLFTEEDSRRQELVRAVLWNSECLITHILKLHSFHSQNNSLKISCIVRSK